MYQELKHIALVTDTHIVEPGEDLKAYRTNESARTLVRMLNSEELTLDGVYFLGDLADTARNPVRTEAVATAASYENAAHILQDLSLPKLHIPGNHDDPGLLAAYHPSSWETAQHGVSRNRVHEVDLIAVDVRTGPEATGYLRQETLEELDGALHESRQAIILSHFPLLDLDSGELNDRLSTTNRHVLNPLLARHREKILALFHGHLHLWSSSFNQGVPAYGVPSSSFSFNWEAAGGNPHPESAQPRGYVVVSISPSGGVVVRSRFLPWNERHEG